MYWISLSLLATLPTASTLPPAEHLCVIVDAPAHVEPERLATLVADALTARLETTALTLGACPTTAPTYNERYLRLTFVEPGQWQWQLHTEEAKLDGTLPAPAGNTGRLSIQLAMSVAEALRPALQHWLSLLQPNLPQPPPPSVVVVPAPTSAKPNEPSLWMWVGVGPRAHWQRPWLTESLEFFAAWPQQNVSPVLGLALQELRWVDAYQVQLRGEGADLHAGILSTFPEVSVALLVVGRAQRLRLTSTRAVLKQTEPWFLNAGGALMAHLPIVQLHDIPVGLFGRAEFWSRPRRFEVEGMTLMRQSHGEFIVGVTAGATPTVLNRANNGQ